MSVEDSATSPALGRPKPGCAPSGGSAAAQAARRHRAPSDQELVDFVVREARLLDDRCYEEWNALFADDGLYWVPLVPDQPEGLDHTSHLYEDKLLRTLRVERLKSARAFSQQPKSRAHHLLQTPTIESRDEAGNLYTTRAEFHYSEAQGDEIGFFVGTAFHRLRVEDGALRIVLKRVNLLNSDAALPAIQLFI